MQRFELLIGDESEIKDLTSPPPHSQKRHRMEDKVNLTTHKNVAAADHKAGGSALNFLMSMVASHNQRLEFLMTLQSS